MSIDAHIINCCSPGQSYPDALVATIGFFDGVHIGHRFLIKHLQKLAASKGLPSMVFTFSEHPRKILQQSYVPRLINTFEEKKQLLCATGIDFLSVIDFTLAFSQLTAESFIKILSEQFHVSCLLVGYDHRFGKNRTDGFYEYIHYGDKYGVEILQAPVFEYEEIQISATLIRKLIEAGNMRQANTYLTYPYTLNGEVVSGHQVGRTMGYPTANLQPETEEKIFPAVGVYAVFVKIDGIRYPGMMNIGYRPTLGINDKLSLEVHVFDFEQKIYGKYISVEFIDRIRNEIKFEDKTQLKAQLKKDELVIKKILLTCN